MKRQSRFTRSLEPTKWTSVIKSFLSELDCPRSLAVWLLFKYNEHSQLVDLEIEPGNYLDAIAFGKAYQATEFLSKFDGLNLPDPDARASLRFAESEEACRLANLRLSKLDFREDPDVGRVFYSAREKIARLLGPVTSTVLDCIFDGCGFGPGVTTTTKGSWLTPFHKMKSVQEVTTGLNYHLNSTLRSVDWPSFSSLHNRVETKGNVIVTVPKTAKTSRTIAIEPGINLFFQKGVGLYLRKLLRHWGVNLNNQMINQDLAKVGSLDNSLATIDLKAASDTIGWELVKFLLPDDWFLFLCALRSPYYRKDGSWVQYHKFSSMGNGFTFELETLIFHSLVTSAAQFRGVTYRGHTYGDDIICPSPCVDLVTRVLNFAGFTLNSKKSYSDSPFRESCGGHFYLGHDVTPFYLKRSKDVIQLIVFANWCYDKSYRHTRKQCYFTCPKPFALKAPPGLTGVYFKADWWELLGTTRRYKSSLVSTYHVMQFFPRHKRLPADEVESIGAAIMRCSPLSIAYRRGRISISIPSKSVLTAREVGEWRRVVGREVTDQSITSLPSFSF